jgi:hypothetical protein
VDCLRMGHFTSFGSALEPVLMVYDKRVGPEGRLGDGIRATRYRLRTKPTFRLHQEATLGPKRGSRTPLELCPDCFSASEVVVHELLHMRASGPSRVTWNRRVWVS